MVMSVVTGLPRQAQSSRLHSALAVKDTKQTTEACMCVSVCVEGGSESVRIAWWRTDPAVMACYKLSYYITEAWSAGVARPRPAKANHQHSGKQPAHTSLPGAASQTSYRNLRNIMSM